MTHELLTYAFTSVLVLIFFEKVTDQVSICARLFQKFDKLLNIFLIGMLRKSTSFFEAATVKL